MPNFITSYSQPGADSGNLKHGMSVKVLKPDWLVEEIRMQLHDALNQYKHEKES